MKKMVAVLVLAVAMVALAGCPSLGIPNPTGNTLVVHNNKKETETHRNYEISQLTVVRVPDECSDSKPTGINQLPEDITVGKKFSLLGLDDGRYWCRAEYRWESYYKPSAMADPNYGKPLDWYPQFAVKSGYVTLSGGNVVDWFLFSAAKE